MSARRARIQAVLYPVFLVSCALATGIALFLIWAGDAYPPVALYLARVFGTCIVLAVASAMTMSATRLVDGPAPEDDR